MIPPSTRRILPPFRLAAFVVALTAALGIVLVLPFVPARYQLQEGRAAPATIKSPVDTKPFPSPTLTRERQQQVANSISDVLITDTDVFDRQMVQTEATLAWLHELRSLRRDAALPPAPDEIFITPDTIEAVRTLTAVQWHEVVDEARNLLDQTRLERIPPTQLPSAKAQLTQRINSRFTDQQKAVVTDLIQALLRANMSVNREATERLRQAARSEVEPVYTRVTQGETIVSDGQLITSLHLEKLAAAGLLNTSVSWPGVLGAFLLAGLMSTVMGMYLWVVQPRSLVNNRRLLLLGLVLVATVVAAKLALPGRPLWAYAFPLAAAPMLLTTLLELPLGLAASIFAGVLVSYVADFSPELLAYAPSDPRETLEKQTLFFATGVVASLVIWRARRVSRFLIAGAGVSLTAAAVVVSFWVLSPDHNAGALTWQLLAGLGNGLIGGALALGLFVLLGMLFDITTSVQLHELAQPDHKLLRRLLQEAPGTYYHSILVGNMAEQVCEAIGADSLLARVGAYYHDIGKVQNPGFFIENQRRGENVHDVLHPLTSASIVTAHVRDGLKLAQEHRLPEDVQAFIREHHGTRLAMAFYNAATHLDPDVDPELFRYPGPTPHSRETAIVMLADSVEAVARSSGEQSPEALDVLVERVVEERIREKQLDRCDLTFRDLEVAKAVFKSALRGIFHPRVQYPEPAAGALPAPAPVAAAPVRPLRVVSPVPEEDERVEGIEP